MTRGNVALGLALGSLLGAACSGSPAPSGSGGAPVVSIGAGGAMDAASGGTVASGGSQATLDLGPCTYDPTLEALVRAELKGRKLERASELSSLVTGTSFTSLAGLDCLTGLHGLELYAPEGSVGSPLDLSPLARLTALESLTLTGYDFKHLEALVGLPLQILTLEDAPIASLAFLNGLPTLWGLTLARLPVAEIQPLPELLLLSHLVLSELGISNLEAFRGLPKLKSVYLTSLTLPDLRGIDGLPALEEIILKQSTLHSFVGMSAVPAFTFLSLYDCSVPTSLAGLDSATQLEELYVTPKSQIGDLSAIAQLSRLITLELPDAAVSDISPVRDCPSLTSLSLPGNQLTDIEPLANHPSLQELDLSRNQLQGVSPLASVGLVSLDIRDNQISSLEGLQKMPLKRLNISNNPLTSIEPLSALTQLEMLIMESVGATSLEALGSLALVSLGASRNSIASLEPLVFTRLSFLDLSDNRIVELPQDFAIDEDCGHRAVLDNNPLSAGSEALLAELCSHSLYTHYSWDHGKCGSDCEVP